jgi:hypothetical protein
MPGLVPAMTRRVECLRTRAVIVRIQLSNSERACVRILTASSARALRDFRPRQKQRAQGKPGARCTRGLVCKVRKKTHTSIQVQRRHPSFPCAMGYGLLRALPDERLFCHRRPRKLALANLAPAPRRQDHTTSPSASGALRQPAPFASTASHRAFVTWPTPLWWMRCAE